MGAVNNNVQIWQIEKFIKIPDRRLISGLLYVNVVNIGCKKSLEEKQKFDGWGVGENVTLYSRESFNIFMERMEWSWTDYRTDEEDEMIFARCEKKA